MNLFNGGARFGYSKIDKEDPDEEKHRRAQFLIYKAMQQADFPRRRPSWFKVRATKLKIRIGRRLRRLRKRMLSIISNAEVGLHKQLMKACKRLMIPSRENGISVGLPANVQVKFGSS